MATSNNEKNIGLFVGAKYTQGYDQFRPAPPAIIRDIVTQFLGKKKPELVVDIGCGTGLSTRYWCGHAAKVVGVDPNQDMLGQAKERANGLPQNEISFIEGYSNNVNLPDQSADVITFATSLHWMDPTTTFKEAGRLLRAGGVLISIDHDFQPSINGRAEEYLREFSKKSKIVAEKVGALKNVVRLDESGHAQRMRDSGQFSNVQVVAVSSVTEGDADALLGFVESWGHISSALRAGATEDDFGYPEFRENIRKSLRGESWKFFWSYSLTIAVK
eukprot:Phypoly_transcript_13185.p1 GENE.Phypoly_transcript_13185~~Phypoly_transcript_13185.p1  ORF type:complete len:274 (+),score=49.69 Phypoly_transcript_13185:239-1060(+)